MNRRRSIGAVAGTTAGSVLAAACGGQVAPTAAPPRGTGCSVGLDLLIPWAPDTQFDQTLKQVARDFSARQSGCKITIESSPTSNDMRQKVTTQMAAGTPPGLASLPPSWTTTMATDKVIRSVDDLFRRDKLRLEDFTPALRRPMGYDSKLWYMSFNANGDFVLHWNKKHFREAGLNPEQGPQTIAEMDDYLRKLTVEQGGDLKRLGSWVWNYYGLGNTTQAWGYAHGGSFYDASKDQITFSDPKIMQAVEWYTGWARRVGGDDRAKELQSGMTLPGGTHFFATGNYSIHVLTSTGLTGVLKADPTIEIGSGPFPGKTKDLAGTMTVGGWGLGAAASGEQREAAWAFMKYVGTDPEGTATLVNMAGSLPAYLPSPSMALAAKDANLKPYVDGIRQAKGVQLGYFAPVSIPLDNIQAVIDGKIGVKEALEAIDRDVNGQIKQLNLKPR